MRWEGLDLSGSFSIRSHRRPKTPRKSARTKPIPGPAQSSQPCGDLSVWGAFGFVRPRPNEANRGAGGAAKGRGGKPRDRPKRPPGAADFPIGIRANHRWEGRADREIGGPGEDRLATAAPRAFLLPRKNARTKPIPGFAGSPQPDGETGDRGEFGFVWPGPNEPNRGGNSGVSSRLPPGRTSLLPSRKIIHRRRNSGSDGRTARRKPREAVGKVGLFSPAGAAVGSRGCQPPGTQGPRMFRPGSPEGATEPPLWTEFRPSPPDSTERGATPREPGG